MSTRAISVIVPVYNGEAYLRECVESILAQSFADFELIVVDDGSEDGSALIIEEFAAEDSRISLIRQEHQNAGAARNNGLKHAQGDYVIFLEPDDIADVCLHEKAYEKAKACDADIVIYGVNSYDKKKEVTNIEKQFLCSNMVPDDKEYFSMSDFLEGKGLTITNAAVKNKLFKRQFLIDNSILFQSLTNSNGLCVVYTALAKAKRIGIVDETLVTYRKGVVGGYHLPRKKAPTCFVAAYDTLWNTIIQDGDCTELVQDLVNIIISGCCYNIRLFSDNIIVKEQLTSIISSSFYKDGLLTHDDDYYRNKGDYTFLKSIIEGREWKADHDERIATDRKFRVVKQANIDSEPKVTVIIPAYNAQNYVGECIESIASQSLKEVEIICIDDGSSDDTLKVLKEYANKDNRITVATQLNSKQSVAKNNGLDLAQGRYICHIDADDFLAPDSLISLYNRMEEDNLDVCFYGGKNMYEHNSEDDGEDKAANEVSLKKSIPENTYTRRYNYARVYKGIDLFCELRNNGEYRESGCMQIVRRNFINENGIRFVPGIYHEDNLYTFEVITKAERASVIKDEFYMRRVHAGSVMTVKPNWAHCYGYFVTTLRMYDMVRDMEDISDVCKGIMYDYIFTRQAACKRIYVNFDAIERQYYYSLSTEEYGFFRTLVIQYANEVWKNGRTNKDLSRLRRKNKDLEKSYEDLEKSFSYKFGRNVTAPARKVYRGVKKLLRG